MYKPGLICLTVISLTSPRALSQTVVVVPVNQGENYRMAARLGTAIRRALVARGRVVSSAAAALAGRPTVSPQDLALAQQKYREGVENYDGLDFKKARHLFKDAVDLFRRAMRGRPRNTTQYVKALHYLAAAALFDNDRLAALAHFAEAFSFAPKQNPDNAVFSPDVIKVHEEAVAASATRGSLQVLSTPSAEVLLNGQAIGASPASRSNLRPGTYLVTCRRAGYETDSQWIAVQGNDKGEVRTELRQSPRLLMYRQTLTEVGRELVGAAPGPATARLTQTLGAASVVLVQFQGGVGQAVWAEGGTWSKRHRGSVAAGGEQSFAEQFVNTSAVVVRPPGACSRAADCNARQRCVDGRCVAAPSGSPFYKTWWFWTVVGVVVVGGSTGAVLGTMPRSETWRMELRPGGVP